jgi:hypothetical protein
MSRIPPCNCGGKTFDLIDGDEITGFYLVECESCGEEYGLPVQDDSAEVVPNIDELIKCASLSLLREMLAGKPQGVYLQPLGHPNASRDEAESLIAVRVSVGGT